MDRFEEQLRQALRRKSPSSGFAWRVQSRAVAMAEARAGWNWFPRLRWVVALVLCLAVIGGLEYRRAQEEKQRGEAARQQVMIALRIAGKKIQIAESKLQHLSD